MGIKRIIFLQEIQHDTRIMTDHIEDGHKIELNQYFDNFVNIQNEKQTLENDLTRLSPCLEMMDCFIARIESIAADATKANEEALDPEDYYVVEELPTTNDDESIGESSPGSEEQFEVKEEPLDEDEYIVPLNSNENESNLSIESDNETALSNSEKVCKPLEVKKSWFHGTLYQCRLCERQFIEIGVLRRHLTTAHDESLEFVTAEHGDPIAVSNIHQCLVCGREIPHCSSAIRGHLKVHDLSLNLYYEQFKQDIAKAKLSLPITDDTLKLKIRTPDPKPLGGISLLKKLAVKPAKDWLNRCTYDCKMCDYTSHVYVTFTQHISRVHDMSGRKYMEINGGKLASTVVKHICQLCGLVMDWDRQVIYMHLAYLHTSTSTSEYVQTYEKTYSENPSLQENEKDTWMNQCTFECEECTPSVTFKTRNKVIHHFYQKHKLTLKDYQQKHKTFSPRTVNHACKVCYKSIRWDSDTITGHLQRLHSLTPDAYVIEYFNGDVQSIVPKTTEINHLSLVNTSSSHTDWLSQCTYKCNLCNFETTTYNSFYPHISKVHEMTADNFLKKYKKRLCHKIVQHTCQLCGFISNWDRALINIHLKSAHGLMSLTEYVEKFQNTYHQFPELAQKESDKWMNQCKFTCLICPSEKHFQTRNTFNLHLVKDHQMECSDYFIKHSNYITTLNKMTCKVCEKSLQWDKDTITSHLECEHKLTPEAYVKEILHGNLDSIIETLFTPPKQTSEALASTFEKEATEWLNMCEYACSLCSSKVNSYTGFISHVVNFHKMSGNSYIEENGGKICTKKLSHKCQLCGFVMDWDRKTIVSHLLLRHQHITTQEYMDKFKKCYSDSPVLIENECEEWMNQCAFECRKCKEPEHFTTKQNLDIHLNREHKMSLEDYIKKEKILTSKLVLHTCMICAKSMRWDSETIKAHLDKTHCTTPEVYFKEKMKDYKKKTAPPNPKETAAAYSTLRPSLQWNDKCKFSCKICYKIFQGKDLLSWHLWQEHKMKEEYYNDHFNTDPIEKVTHTCMLCADVILFDSQTMKKHLQIFHNNMHINVYKSEHFDEYRLNQFTDQCPDSIDDSIDDEYEFFVRNLYYCKICKTILKGSRPFKEHILYKHSLNLSDYTDKNGSGILEKHHHICQYALGKGNLCLKTIPWDEYPLSEHLSKEHKLSAKQYNSRYMLDYNNKAFERVAEKEKELWTDKCTFLCKICCQVFKTKSHLVSHVSSTHSKQIEDTLDLMDVVVNCVLHSCQLCGMNILWESESLEAHFKSKHKCIVTLQGYKLQYMPIYKESEECTKKVCKLDDWMSRCIYKCKLCTRPTSFSKRSYLLQHLTNHHLPSKNGYFAKYENETFITKEEHICQICAKPLIWDPYHLQQHIEQIHRIKPAIYKAKYLCQYTQNKEVIIKPNSNEQQMATLLIKQIPKNNPVTKNEGTSLNPVQISERETARSSAERNTKNEAQTWARGCLYTCHICKTYFAGFRSVAEHMKNVHISGSTNKNIVTVNMHSCQLCNQRVVHDEIELKAHLKTRHYLSIPEYFDKFKVNLSVPKFTIPHSPKMNPLSYPKLVVKRKVELANPVTESKRPRSSEPESDEIVIKEELMEFIDEEDPLKVPTS